VPTWKAISSMRVPARVRRMGRRGARTGGGPSRNARRRKGKGRPPAAAQVAETARTCPFHNTRRPPPTTHHHFCFLHPLSLNRSFPTTTPPRSSTSSRCYRTTIHSFGFGASTLATRVPQLGSPSSSTSPPSTLPPHTSPPSRDLRDFVSFVCRANKLHKSKSRSIYASTTLVPSQPRS